MLFRLLKAKDVVIAIFLSLALALAPAQVNAQEYAEAPEMEEEAPAGGLMAAPPVVKPMQAAPSHMGADGYRAPTVVPGTSAIAAKPKPAGQATHVKPAVASPEAHRTTAFPSTMAKADSGTEYVVQPGDTAPAIAKKLLGSSKRWRELVEFNGIKDPNTLQVGQKLKVPGEVTPAPAKVQTAQTSNPADYKSEAPAASKHVSSTAKTKTHVQTVVARPVATKASVSADVEDADAGYYNQAGGSYTIQRADNMAKIAKKTLGSTKRWREIAKANPGLNPNKLIVGQTITIPGGANADAELDAPSAPAITSPTSFDANSGNPMGGMVEPPPAAPPPLAYPSGQPTTMMPQQGSPMNTMVPMAPPPSFEPPPAPPPVMSGIEVPPPSGPANMQTTTQSLYHEERYRIPDELKPTDYSPYFANANGYHGLFNTECSFYPYIKTWHLGLGLRFDNYKYYNGSKGSVAGNQWMIPVNFLYTGQRFMAGLTVPFQSWTVRPAGTGAPNVSMTSIQDPELRFGYQIWKNYEGTHAVTLHVAGRFPTENYHVPFWAPGGITGKTRVGARIGPANATNGAWGEFGGGYSGVLSDRWTSHLNMAVAHDSDDDITRYIYRSSLDYRVNQHFSLNGELDGTTWDMAGGRNDANVDFTPGMAWFNDRWQGYLGFPYAIQSKWGVGHDFGVSAGVNARWE